MSAPALIPLTNDHDLMTRMRHRLESLAYSSRLYRLMISGPVPRTLVHTPSDPWPGNARAGQEMVEGCFVYAGQRFSAHPPDWLPDKASLGWLRDVHSLSWLRDLRALGGDAGRRVARSLLSSWLDAFENWSPLVWDAPMVAMRITHIVMLHDFVLASADNTFRARVFESLVRHVRHLQRLAPGAVGGSQQAEETVGNIRLPQTHEARGTDILIILRGLLHGGIALPDGDKALGVALGLLPSALRHVLMADGTCVERNPSEQALVLRALVDIRQALKVSAQPMVPELPVAIEKAAAALRLFRAPDGGFSLFNGAREEDPVVLEALLTQADARGRAPKSLPQGGYERLTAGRLSLLVDVGAPPAEGVDGAAHAGLTSFELCVGRERLFVNCGAHAALDEPHWYQALAATAAHTTLSLDNTNSCEVLAGGGIGRRPQSILLSRTQEQGFIRLDIGHDGYCSTARIMHHRHLMLAEQGDELRGEDVLRGSGGHEYAVRFHLHPLVQASLIQNGMAVLLRLPSGAGFRFQTGDTKLLLEESIYAGRTPPRPCQQIVIKGISREGETNISWQLTREGPLAEPPRRTKKTTTKI